MLLFAIGSGIGASGTSTPVASTPAPAPTVTVTAAPEPAPTVTVTARPKTPAKPAAPAKAAGPASTISGDGIYLVGKDIKPGTYRATPKAGANCYWQRLSGLSGDLNDTLANGLPAGPVVVTIKSTDKAFESQRCGAWTRL
ncbi:hypothetical protein [Actinopolymorpha pittospori]|uniref:Uncharacterized protein n=1 Tax=Actinopolymorpha pittospori TaxID=648752 RepID=A0A927N008_9ACTN|nr:hypothetical protein [Actinopolymorpha pittospori]MBE1606220.1 hypothetical protein [Actinopolymorpha pittospori]